MSKGMKSLRELPALYYVSRSQVGAVSPTVHLHARCPYLSRSHVVRCPPLKGPPRYCAQCGPSCSATEGPQNLEGEGTAIAGEPEQAGYGPSSCHEGPPSFSEITTTTEGEGSGG